MSSNTYTQQLEQQLEELQHKLAMAQWEAEEYKNIIEQRKGQLVVVQDIPNYPSQVTFYADKVFKACRDTKIGKVGYELVKDRTGPTGKIYTLEEMRAKALNFWQ